MEKTPADSTIPFPSEVRRTEFQFRLNKFENRQRATQLCQKEIHIKNSISHKKLINKGIFFGKIQFHIGENFFHESEIEILSRDLDFHLGKFEFHLAWKLTWKRYSV